MREPDKKLRPSYKKAPINAKHSYSVRWLLLLERPFNNASEVGVLGLHGLAQGYG